MKTNFLKTVEHSLFLLLAILGTLAGYSQQSQHPTTGNIVGSKTAGGLGLLSAVPIDNSYIGGRGGSDTDTGQLGTGGKGTNSGTGAVEIILANSTEEIDGKSSPRNLGTDTGGRSGQGTSTTGDYAFEIGGGKSSDGRLSVNSLTSNDISGRDTGTGPGWFCSLNSEPIGGRDTGGGKGTTSDTGQIVFLEFECTFSSFSKDLQGCLKKPSQATLLFQC